MEVQPRTSGGPTLNYSGIRRIPWESALKVKEVQEGWMFLEKKVLIKGAGGGCPHVL